MGRVEQPIDDGCVHLGLIVELSKVDFDVE
jgi:hypothetical protein